MTNIVTAEQVYDLAGITVDSTVVARAQLTIGSVVGVTLSDAPTFAALRLADQRRIVNAVVWQCVYLDADPTRFAGSYAGNVASASANGASITFREGADGSIAPLAQRELDALSWRQPVVTVRTLRPYSRASVVEAGVWSDTTTRTPALSPTLRGPQPDPWRP